MLRFLLLDVVSCLGDGCALELVWQVGVALFFQGGFCVGWRLCMGFAAWIKGVLLPYGICGK